MYGRVEVSRPGSGYSLVGASMDEVWMVSDRKSSGKESQVLRVD